MLVSDAIALVQILQALIGAAQMQQRDRFTPEEVLQAKNAQLAAEIGLLSQMPQGPRPPGW